MPQPLATSITPSSPTVVLVPKRPKSDRPSFTRPCSSRLTPDQGSPRLEKKFETPVRTGDGTTAR